MYDFIINHWQDIIIVTVFITLLTLLYKKKKYNVVRKIILALVVQAEKQLGSGTGELKYASVIEQVYKNLPSIIRFLFTEKEIDAFIAEGVAKLKEYLSRGVTLSGYDDEVYISTINKDGAD